MSDTSSQSRTAEKVSPAGLWYVGDSQDIPERGRLVVKAGELSIGIFRIDGQLYAWKNICAHMGGPVCQGLMVPRVVEKLNDKQQHVANDFDEETPHIACPWHGYEYNLKTGLHAGNPNITLKGVTVEESPEGVYVRI